MDISYSTVGDKSEIDILRGKKSEISNFLYEYDEETLELLKKNFDRPDSLYVMVKHADQFVGFCSIDSDWWEPGYFFLREIFVMPDNQGKKIGETMMSKCIDHAKQAGAIGIVTETAFENVPMQGLCEKLGFETWENPEWKSGITYKLHL